MDIQPQDYIVTWMGGLMLVREIDGGIRGFAIQNLKWFTVYEGENDDGNESVFINAAHADGTVEDIEIIKFNKGISE
jgi:hypothetical protein